MPDPAIPVSVSGFTWTAALVGVLNLLVGGVIVALIRTRPALKKIAADREANLLNERAEEMEKLSKRIEKLEAERAIDQIRLSNMTKCFDHLILLLETAPDKAVEHVMRVKVMREAQIASEELERQAIWSEIIKRHA